MAMRASTDQRRALPWYRVPVVWLGMLVFAGSLAGCIWMVVLGARFSDDALPVSSHAVMGVPAHPPPSGLRR